VKVFMLQTTKGSENGINVLKLQAGTEYDLTEKLAKSLVDGGLARAVSEESRPDLEKIVRGVVEEVRQGPVEPSEVATEDVEPEEPITSKFRKSKRTR